MRRVWVRRSIPRRSSASRRPIGFEDPSPLRGEGRVRGGSPAQRETCKGSGGPMDVRDEILNRIDERQDEWLRLLGDLVRRPSENPPGDTRAAAECVVEYLEGKGQRREGIEHKPG